MSTIYASTARAGDLVWYYMPKEGPRLPAVVLGTTARGRIRIEIAAPWPGAPLRRFVDPENLTRRRADDPLTR